MLEGLFLHPLFCTIGLCLLCGCLWVDEASQAVLRVLGIAHQAGVGDSMVGPKEAELLRPVMLVMYLAVLQGPCDAEGKWGTDHTRQVSLTPVLCLPNPTSVCTTCRNQKAQWSVVLLSHNCCTCRYLGPLWFHKVLRTGFLFSFFFPFLLKTTSDILMGIEFRSPWVPLNLFCLFWGNTQ